MANLLDLLQQKLRPNSPDQPVRQAEQLIRAGTGKDVTTRGPQQSTLQAEQAARTVEAAGREQQVQGAETARQLRGQGEEIQQREEQATSETLQQFSQVQSELANKTQSVLNDLSRGREKLDLAKFQEQAELVGFGIRLSSKQYTDRLQQAAKLSRIQNDAQFNEESYRAIFEDDLDLFRDETVLKQMADSTDREFRKQLAQMDINYAIEIGEAKARELAGQSLASGLGGIASGGAQAWFSSQQRQPAAPTQPTTTEKEG